MFIIRLKVGIELKKFKFKLSESDIKLQCKQYLSLKGWFHFHIMAGIGSYSGSPDRIAVKNGRVLFIEVKTEKGTQSNDQIDFQADVEGSGGEYYVVRSLEDLIRIERGIK